MRVLQHFRSPGENNQNRDVQTSTDWIGVLLRKLKVYMHAKATLIPNLMHDDSWLGFFLFGTRYIPLQKNVSSHAVELQPFEREEQPQIPRYK